MALVGNGVRMGGGPHNAYSNAGIQSVERGRWNRSPYSFYAGEATVISGASIADTAAFPNGYQPPYTWVIAPKGGGFSAYNTIYGEGDLSISSLAMGVALASSLSGTGTISAASLSLIVQLAGALTGSGTVSTATLQAIINMSAALSGSGSISAAALSLIVSLEADLTASGTITANLTGLLSMAADIIVTGDVLNTANVGQSVWRHIIESGYTAEEIVRLLTAVVVNDAENMGGAAVFKSIDGVTDRVVGTITGDDRAISSLDPD